MFSLPTIGPAIEDPLGAYLLGKPAPPPLSPTDSGVEDAFSDRPLEESPLPTPPTSPNPIFADWESSIRTLEEDVLPPLEEAVQRLEARIPVISPTPESDVDVGSDDELINPFDPIAIENHGPQLEKIHTAALSNAIFLPHSFFETAKALIHAIKTHDREGIVEYAIKLISAPFGITNAVEDIIVALFFRSIAATVITITSLTFGFVFVAIELGLEIARLIRTVQFRKSLNITDTLEVLQKLNYDDLSKLKRKERKKALNELSYTLSTIKKMAEKALGRDLSQDILEQLQTHISVVINDPNRSIAPLLRILDSLKIHILNQSLTQLQKDYFALSEEELASCRERAILQYNSLPDFEKPANELTATQETTNDLFTKLKAAAEESRLQGKLRSLGRRVQPKSINFIKEHILTFTHFQNKPTNNLTERQGDIIQKDAIAFGVELLKNIDEQSRKTMIVHAIGVTAICIGVLALAFGAASFPPIVLLFLLGIGLAFQLARANAEGAFLSQEGYRWNIKKVLIPAFILDLFEKKEGPPEYKILKDLRFDREQGKHVPRSIAEIFNSPNPGKKEDPMIGAIHEPAKKYHWSDDLSIIQYLR